MGVREYKVELTGIAPGLVMHRDNIDWADEMEAWRADPDNKGKSRPGDDRHPAFTWIGSVYHDGETVALPGDNMARCLMEGGAQTPIPGAKHGKTFKAQTQSGMMSRDAFWKFYCDGREISWKLIEDMMKLPTIKEHQAACRESNMDLLIKRVRIGQAKHIRVRPWFRNWSATGVLSVWDEKITAATLTTILQQAGEYKGLCDWRPGSRTPGPYGRFRATVKEL